MVGVELHKRPGHPGVRAGEPAQGRSPSAQKANEKNKKEAEFVEQCRIWQLQQRWSSSSCTRCVRDATRRARAFPARARRRACAHGVPRVHPRGHRGGCRLTGASPHAPPGWCAAAAQKPAAKKDDKNVKPAKKLPDIPGLDSALFKRAMAEQKANGIEMNGPKIHRLRPACCAARGAWCVCAGGQGAGDPGGVGGGEACATGRCAKTQEAMCPGAAAPRGRWGVGVRCPTACESGCSAWSAWRRVRGRVTLRLALVYWQPEDR